MPYQRGGRDYGPSSTGGTTRYSSRRQVSIGVPDRKSRKPVQVRPAKPAKKDPGVAGVPGGLTGRGQAALTSKPAKSDPGVMGARGGLTGRGQAPMTAQPAKADPGVMGTPGGSTGRGENNPARTDPHVMGLPGGVTGRQPSTSRLTSAAEPSDREMSFGPMRPKSLDPYLSFSGTPRTQPEKARAGTNAVRSERGVPASTSNRYGLTFNGPINSLPWASDRLPLASSLTRDLSPNSRGFTSPPLTPEEQQELARRRQHVEDVKLGLARATPKKDALFKKSGGQSTPNRTLDPISANIARDYRGFQAAQQSTKGASGSASGSIARNPWEVAHSTVKGPIESRPSISRNAWEASTIASTQNRPAWDVAKSDYGLDRAPDPLFDQRSYWDWAWGKADAAADALVQVKDTAVGVAGPAFRKQNTVGSLALSGVFDPWREAVPGYQLSQAELRGYEQFEGVLKRSRSPTQTADIKRRIDRELDDQRRLDEAGWVGDIMEVAMAFADPVTYVPVGGAVYRTYRSGRTIYQGARAAAKTGFFGSSLSEAGLASTQETRTPQETISNIVGGTLTGGALGGTSSATRQVVDNVFPNNPFRLRQDKPDPMEYKSRLMSSHIIEDAEERFLSPDSIIGATRPRNEIYPRWTLREQLIERRKKDELANRTQETEGKRHFYDRERNMFVVTNAADGQVVSARKGVPPKWARWE